MQKSLVIVVLFSLAACGSGGGAQPTPTDIVRDDSPAYAKMASIDAGSRNPPLASIEEFRILFDRLSQKCPNDTQDRIADYIVKAQEILKDAGVGMTLIEITRYVDQSMPAGTEVGNCAEVVAAWIALGISE